MNTAVLRRICEAAFVNNDLEQVKKIERAFAYTFVLTYAIILRLFKAGHIERAARLFEAKNDEEKSLPRGTEAESYAEIVIFGYMNNITEVVSVFVEKRKISLTTEFNRIYDCIYKIRNDTNFLIKIKLSLNSKAVSDMIYVAGRQGRCSIVRRMINTVKALDASDAATQQYMFTSAVSVGITFLFDWVVHEGEDKFMELVRELEPCISGSNGYYVSDIFNHACEMGSLRIVKYFVEQLYIQPNRCQMRCAVSRGRKDIAMYLFDQGCTTIDDDYYEVKFTKWVTKHVLLNTKELDRVDVNVLDIIEEYAR